MDTKQAPPPYAETMNDDPPVGTSNAGYVAPTGDQGMVAPGTAAAYPPQVGYPYPPAYGMQQPPPAAGYYTQPGYTAVPAGYGYQQTVVMNQPVGQAMVMGGVPDHMGLAIFTTLCCCWPLGLVAIMRAQESRHAMERGDVNAARTYSGESRRYSMWAIAGGCISIVVCILIMTTFILVRF